MKLSINGIKEQEAWKKAGIALPGYDAETASEKAKENPVWVHFGIGNIFRVFIGGIADGLLEEGVLDRGITCAATIFMLMYWEMLKMRKRLTLFVRFQMNCLNLSF